jgi:hypothetical protein
MDDPLLINISNLLTGQRDKFLTDSVSDYKKRVLPDREAPPLLNPRNPSRDKDSL